MSKQDSFFVDLLDESRSQIQHVSFRPQAGKIVLNTRKNEVWGREVSMPFPINQCRYWRFWIVLRRDGSFGIMHNGVLLCSMPGLITAEKIVAFQSDTTVRCALPADSDFASDTITVDLSNPEAGRAIFPLEYASEAKNIVLERQITQQKTQKQEKSLTGSQVTVFKVAGRTWVSCNLGSTGKTPLVLKLLSLIHI